MSGSRRAASPVGIVLGAGALGLLIASLANPFPYVADDALFYVVIGRNVADGYGITFSQVLPTNGFQPLWQAVVAAVIAAGQAVGIEGDVAQLRLVLLTCWACLGAGLLVLDRVLRLNRVAAGGRAAALAIALAILGGPYGTLGSEASLVFLLAVLVLLALERAVPPHGEPTPRAAVVLGLLIGLLLLSRVDTMFLVAAVGVALLARLGRHRGAGPAVRTTALAAGTALVVVAPYLAWNQARFGRLLPISGAVKLRFDRLWLEPSSVDKGAVLLAGAIALGALALPVRRRAGFPWPWLVATTGTAGICAFYFAFSPGALTSGSWYHAPHVLALALSVGIAADAALRWRPALRPLALAGTVGVLVVAVAFSWSERVRGANADQAREVRAFGAQARDALADDPDAVLATVDYPGYVALVTRRPTIALDGLTGTFELQRDLRDDGAECTLARLGTTHLVTDAPGRLEPVPGEPDRRQQQVTAWLYDAAAGPVEVVGDPLVSSPVGLELWSLALDCP